MFEPTAGRIQIDIYLRLVNIYVADIRGGNKTNNSSVRLDRLLTSEAPASPTLYTQRRRESSSPEHALKLHHIVHVHIYIFK